MIGTVPAGCFFMGLSYGLSHLLTAPDLFLLMACEGSWAGATFLQSGIHKR